MKKYSLPLAAALLVTSTNAFAQQQQPPADPNAPPSAQPPAAPAADKPAEDDNPIPKALRPNRWRFSSFSWSQSVTTTTAGIGRDNIGHEDEFYGWDFSFAPQYWFYDEKDDKVFVNAEIGASVEWTDSATTTEKREPQLTDFQLGLGYNRSIFTSEDSEWLTRLFLRGRAIFPTSEISQAQGRYLTTSLGASVLQVFKLLGNDADGLNNLTVIGGVTWSHLFARSYTATNPELERTRQSAGGQTILSDQLTFNSMDIDRVIPTLFTTLPLYKDLSFNTTWRLIGRFRHDFEGDGCDVIVMDECVEADRDPNRTTYLTNSSVDFSLTQGIYNVAFLTIGYNNETLTLGENGKSRNPFYSPSALFYLDISLQLDQVYAKATAGSGSNRNPFVQATNEGTGYTRF